MPNAQDPRGSTNTVAMLGQAYSLLGFRIVDGVVGAGFPQKPSHSAVFAQINPAGSRLSELARGANMSPQAMGELVDELESLGYVVRRPDPRDRRAKLISYPQWKVAYLIKRSKVNGVCISGSGTIKFTEQARPRRPRR